ncbi:MAG: leucine-rich repeat domain-containing protein, partial [Bacillota bacterium]
VLEEADSDYYLGWCLFKNSETIQTFRTESDSGEANGLEFLPAGMFDSALHNQDSNVGLTSISLAEGLKIIKKGAFHYQKLLTSVTFPASLEDLGKDAYIDGPNQQFEGTSERSEYGAFEDCLALASISFPENSQLKVLGGAAFRNTSLTSVEIPSKSFELYGYGPFQGCANLSEVYFEFDDSQNIPQPLTYQRAGLSIRKPTADFFYSNESFKVFVKDEVVDGFRESLEEGSSAIIQRNMPVYSDSMIYDIGSHRLILEETTCALYNQPGWVLGYYFGESNHIDISNIDLSSINPSMNIVEIGSYAFHKEVQTITLPETVSTIAPYAFSGCTDLSDVIFPNINSLVIIGEEAFFNTEITSFRGGANLKVIGSNAFQNCESLEWVDFKESSHAGGSFEIGMSAFSECSSLKYVRLPSNYTYMEDATFSNCSVLRYMVFENSTPPDDMFGKVSARFQDVPHGVVTAYVLNDSARVEYEELYPDLPNQLKDRFVVWSDPEITSPGPEDLLALN